MKNSKVVSFLSPFKVGQAGNLWTLPRRRGSKDGCMKEMWNNAGG